MVAGWAADAGSASGTGVDAVVVWAWPSGGGAAILAGVANYGYARPDVAAALASTRFGPSGYGLSANLPVGTYTLTVYAHSMVNNSWNSPTVRTVTVTAPPSRPLMWVDAPVQNESFTQNPNSVFVAGWAVDTAAASGPGVDAVDIYAYPTAGGGPILLGVTSTGLGRPDVGNALGSVQFQNSGFAFTYNGVLPAGGYTIVVYAHSVIGGFNDSVAVPVIVR
jgi:hypothetical protein